jgi:3D (Asp-Asp-Asp) domain-containing protein
MSPIQTNTQTGLITCKASSDLSASIGCFANISTAGLVALPTTHTFALYVIANAYGLGGYITPPSGTTSAATAYCENGTTTLENYECELQPLMTDRNVRVIAADNTITTPGMQVTTDGSGKVVAASTGNNILGISEEAGVTGQYVLIRPIGGIQTK